MDSWEELQHEKEMMWEEEGRRDKYLEWKEAQKIAMQDECEKCIDQLEYESTTKNDLGVEKIIDELEKEFEKVNIPIMDKLTLFAKTQNALYRCADMRGNTKRKGNPIEGNNESYNCENWIP